MKKYIDADKLKELLSQIEREFTEKSETKGYTTLEYRDKAEGLNLALQYIDSLQQEQSEEDLFEHPVTPIKDAIEVTSRMQYIDDDLRPIAEFILDYASWNLHKDEWNQPVIEVPLFRVLDALAQRGKPYCCAG